MTRIVFFKNVKNTDIAVKNFEIDQNYVVSVSE